MKKTVIAFVLGVLLTACAFAFAAEQPIKLIVNGQEIQCDVPPQNVNDRVLVPARFVAEPLGATVEWDGKNNAVIVTSKTESVEEVENVTEATFEGMRAIIVNETTYFCAIDYLHKIETPELNSPNRIDWDETTKTATIHLDGEEYIVPCDDPENVQIYNGLSYFNVKFYR